MIYFDTGENHVFSIRMGFGKMVKDSVHRETRLFKNKRSIRRRNVGNCLAECFHVLLYSYQDGIEVHGYLFGDVNGDIK